MIVKSNDLDNLMATMEPYLSELTGFEPEAWLGGPNVALTDGEGNFGLFEYEAPGIYTGHYFYKTARGKAAFALASEMLDMMFEIAELIKGLTPTDHKGAVWLSKKLGFTSYGTVTIDQDYIIFIKTKAEHVRNNDE